MTTLREKMKLEMTLRGFSIRTQKLYLSIVMKLCEYYDNRPPAKLSPDEIKAYLLYLTSERKFSSSTYNVVVHALKFFYHTVLRKDITHYIFPRSKESTKLPKILTAAEVTNLIKATKNIKHRTILILAYGAGLRASEIVNLKIKDIDSERMIIHINDSKGNKDRYAILSPMMLKALREYWQRCRSKVQCKEEWLFLGDTPHKPMAPSTTYFIFKRATYRVGIIESGGIHSLRHAFATHTLEAGVDLYTIKHLLGHARIKTTMRYLSMTTNKLKSVTSPVELLQI